MTGIYGKTLGNDCPFIAFALSFDSDDPTLHLSIHQGDILHNPLHNSPHAARFDGAEPIARLHGLAQHQAEVGGLHVHVMMLTKISSNHLHVHVRLQQRLGTCRNLGLDLGKVRWLSGELFLQRGGEMGGGGGVQVVEGAG